MNIVRRFTKIAPLQKIKETYEEDSALFGLLKYDRLIKKEKIGEELRIIIDRIPEDIFINGIKCQLLEEIESCN